MSDYADVPALDATLRHIVISRGHDYWGRRGEGRMQHGAELPEEVEAVADMGLRGDRYFGEKPGGKQQVTFLDFAVVEQVREDYRVPKLPPTTFRRNLIVEGADLSAWLGKKFSLQGVVFEGSQECKPCHWMDRAIAPGVQDFMKENFRGGLRARVLTTGVLRVGT